MAYAPPTKLSPSYSSPHDSSSTHPARPSKRPDAPLLREVYFQLQVLATLDADLLTAFAVFAILEH